MAIDKKNVFSRDMNFKILPIRLKDLEIKNSLDTSQ